MGIFGTRLGHQLDLLEPPSSSLSCPSVQEPCKIRCILFISYLFAYCTNIALFVIFGLSIKSQN